MNNKGFTLVELLAVMVILISISLVTVSSVTSSFTRREEKEKEEQIELAIGAAKIYFSLEDSSDMCVKIQQLVDGKYITDDKKIDTLNTAYYIQLSGNAYQYKSSCS